MVFLMYTLIYNPSLSIFLKFHAVPSIMTQVTIFVGFVSLVEKQEGQKWDLTTDALEGFVYILMASLVHKQ